MKVVLSKSLIAMSFQHLNRTQFMKNDIHNLSYFEIRDSVPSVKTKSAFPHKIFDKLRI